ncbi:hypothetical protein [Solitalea lacus]|uniref:hypothetical protein n=1 Tax=Solitalea lacus TaxID=2911172 RepID=UPI001EDB6BE7|nr:hypothetical protein [Solitalea lacus]UKJ09186.1 hypothetical protein L2B55_08515 [Solitalea lacus]
MKTGAQLSYFLKQLPRYNKLGTFHISLYAALLEVWKQQQYDASFRVSRRKLMQLSSIKSIATYHKCLKELIALGFIDYQPSYHPKKASRISLLQA